MGNPLQQTIEALAKEKGIEPDVIVTAIEDAVLTASRRYYSREFKSTEHLRTSSTTRQDRSSSSWFAGSWRR